MGGSHTSIAEPDLARLSLLGAIQPGWRIFLGWVQIRADNAHNSLRGSVLECINQQSRQES